VTIEPGHLAAPVPNSSLTVVDEATRLAIEERWRLLEKTINRTHRHDPLPSGAKPADIVPWTPPVTTGATERAGEPIYVDVNGNPTSAAPGGFSSRVNEPSVAATGDYVFYTANWYAAASTDAGVSWSYVNPYTGPFPEPAGEDFCCDQQAHYDNASNTVFWLQQLIPATAASNGTQRVNVDQGANGTWDCFYDVTPQQAGFANLSFPDYPDLALSDQHLFLTSNIFPTNGGGFLGAFVARLPLAQMTTCAATSATFYTDTSFGSFRLTQEAGATMYFADLETTSSIRVWSWPQASASPSSVTRIINSFLIGTRACPGPDSRDWCGFIDSRLLGGALAGNRAAFFWVAQQNPVGGFPFPYTQGVILDTSNSLAVLEQPLIWSNDAAWVYPSASANSNGDLGGTIMWGGGTFFPQCSVWLVDDANGDSFSPFDHQVVISGTSGPSSNRSGDYLSTRNHHPYDLGYSGTCFSYLSSSTGTSRYVRFGRTEAFVTNLFTDGFESGNVSAWSSFVNGG
ncbi:MAG: hypothetical protein KDD11_18285, partial [Acidobacteria bacterium]|nr:hypothetical protein [Acidobacteriota bacterium]